MEYSSIIVRLVNLILNMPVPGTCAIHIASALYFLVPKWFNYIRVLPN